MKRKNLEIERENKKMAKRIAAQYELKLCNFF